MLFVVCCVMCDVCCLMCVVCCRLLMCLPFVDCCLLLGACCRGVLFAGRRVLYVVCHYLIVVVFDGWLVLCVVCWVRVAAFSLLFGVCCLLLVVWCLWCGVC